MNQLNCVSCAKPIPDGYACATCAIDQPRRQLADIADQTPAAREIAHRQARRGTGSSSSPSKPGSQLPIGLAIAGRLDAIQNQLTTWARHVAGQRGAPAWDGTESPDLIIRAANYLATHLEWMRHRPEADAFLTDVTACARLIQGLIDPPAQRALVGMCDCGRTLYARPRQQYVECPDCTATWDVDESRDILWKAVDEKHVTAAEAAHLAAYRHTDRTSDQIRKIVNKWASRGTLDPADHVHVKHQHNHQCQAGCATTTDTIAVYRLGDIVDQLERTPRRTSATAA